MAIFLRIPILAILIFLISNGSALGQRLWQSQGEPLLTPAGSERFIYADEAEYFELDTGIWQAVAARIPMEVERLHAEQGFAVEIPMPSGQTETFLLAESPIMESSLASQYPEIKTYVGYSPNHPDWYGKFDFTPQGFHGMVLGTSGGTVFIDPVFHGPLYPTSYIAYHRDHFISSATNIFSCDATNDVVDTSLDNGQLLGRFGSCELRTYRLALAATGEYTAFHGGTVALGLAAQNTTMNRVNGVFERDMAITMTIIANNNLLVYTNSGSDPYSNGNAGTMLGQNQSNIDAVIGSANYDIGHVFGVGSGGIAGLGVVCSNSGKARGVTGSGSPVGDPFDIDYVAHEIGHQFSMNHTQNNNCNRNNATAMEPGSASTIMGYAGICAPNVQNNSDDYFHGISLEECGAFITSGSHTCPVKTTLSNSEPVISSTTSNVTIPANTPFSLTAIATDPDAGDVLTYCWEQMDNQTGFTMPPSSTSTGGPMFRSLDPKTSPTRYFPDLQDLIAGNVSQWEVLPGVSRSMDFRVTVRDNASGGGCNDHADLTLTVDENAGPFLVQNPNNTGITWDAATSETVTWDVAGTASGAVNCGNVDILLSTDGGLTFSTIASNVPNSGSTSVNVPNSPTTNGLIMVQCANGSFFDISDNTFTINQITNDYTISTGTSNESVCAGGSVSFTLDLTAFGTFSDPVSLSVSGGGAGISTNLSASNVTPTTSVNLNVSTTSSASGSNTFTVTANSTTGTKTLDLFLDVLTTPSSPSLLAPVNGVTTANPATLTWSSAANETYDITVFSSINPNVVFESATGLTSASYTTSALANSTTYYYQVSAINACGSATSGIDSFTTSTCLTYTNTTDYPGSTAAGTFVQSPITVSVSPTAQVSSVSIPNMQGDMTWISDLEFFLVSPTGTQTSLIDYRTLCNNEDDWNHGLEDGGLNQSGIPCPPTDGLIYDPTNPFSSFNNELVDGDWTLIFYDYFTGDAATLTEWTMELCTFDPCGSGLVTNQNFSGCDSYTYNGTTYTSSATVTENLTASNGCDSTVNTTITINPSATTNQSFAGCDSYVYNGTTYTSSTSVTENLTTTAGCDSTVNTAITINPSATTNQSFSGCDSYVYNGTTYTSSTTVTENLTTVSGCDSTVNTTITINQSATTNQSFAGCDSYVYNGTTYTSSTSVTENLTTVSGCDSTVNTTITINPSATTNQSFSGCDSYVYNGTTYTSSTTVTENLTASNGCDSTVNTAITINPSTTTNQSFTGCDSYVYNGTTYTSSTTVTENLTASNGCDSTVNTTITINPSATANQSFAGCDSYVYNGTTYTSSTSVTENLTTVSGCDSTVNTTITINQSATTNQSFSGCDSYVYNGTTYTSSTTVTENLTTVSGCDSTVNTTITINPAATTNQSFTGCDSYVYNGTTYTSSTTVTENLTRANGCDSTVNTTITITPTPSPPAANGASIVAGSSATLSASGAGSGQSYAWLTSNGTVVGNGASYTTPILNTTTIYFVEISDDASNCTSSRTTVIVTVTSPDILWTGNTSSDWNIASNWSTNLVPSLSDSVTIPSNNVVNYPIIQNDVAIGHTTVEVFASITIAPNGILRLSDELINNGLVLLQSDISGDGVLMDTLTNANFVGSLSIERYNPGDQFHIIGSPVASSMTGLSNDLSGPTGNGLTGSDGLAVTPDLTTSIYLNSGVCDSLVIGSNYGNLFSYDESLVQNCSFEGWVVESAGILIPGKGYMAYLTPGATIDLEGPPNTGSTIGPILTNSGGTTFTGAGWNLVSNPYPSYFDVEEFIIGNNGVNSPNVFVDTGLYSGTYSSILPVTGQSVVALGQGFVIRNGGDNATPAINPIYSNAMRETSGTGFRSPASNRLKVDVIQDNLRDKTEVYWAQGGHEGFHRFEDGYKFKGLLHQPQIGSLLEDELMAVQTLPETEDLSRIIPLVVNGIESPMYSIEVDPDFIPLAYHVFLIDNAEGRRYNARILPEIPFQNLGNEERRFDIEITKSSLHADDLDFLENIEVYQSNNQLVVAPQNTSEATYRIDVYDVLGRCLMTKPLTAGRQVILLNTPSQLLNIRLSSGTHQHTVKTWWQVD